jgi:hypothetical protein
MSTNTKINNNNNIINNKLIQSIIPSYKKEFKVPKISLKELLYNKNTDKNILDINMYILLYIKLKFCSYKSRNKNVTNINKYINHFFNKNNTKVIDSTYNKFKSLDDKFDNKIKNVKKIMTYDKFVYSSVSIPVNVK